MKKIIYMAAVALFAASCTDSGELCEPQSNEPIDISAIISDITPTRTTISGTTGTASWSENDAIGVFSPQSLPVGANVQFTVAGLPSNAVWTPSSQLYWVDGSTLHTFTAYAPYASGNTSAASVKLPALNSQTGVIAPAQDFLVSNNYATPGVARSGAVGLVFTHAFALVEFKMAIGNGLLAGTTLTSLTLAGGSSDKLYTSDNASTIALATGAITTGAATNTITVSPSTAPTLTATPVSQYVLMLPGTFTAPTLAISIKDGGSTTIDIPGMSIGTSSFAAGSKYSYTVTISRTAITISTPTITDWRPVAGNSISPII